MEVLNIIVYCQTLLSLAVAVLCFIRYSQRPAYIQWVGWLFLVGFVSNSLQQVVYWLGYGRYLNLIGAVYGLTNIALLTILYYHLFARNYGKILLATYALFFFAAGANLLFIQKEAINSNAMFVSCLIVIVYCLLYFYRLMMDLPGENVHKVPTFWINSGYLIYYAGTLFIFAFTSYLVDVLKDNLILYWSLHNLLDIATHILVLCGLYHDLYKPKHVSPQPL